MTNKKFNPDKADAEELIYLLQQALRYFADLNGSNWIPNNNDPGTIEMKGRAKSLQSLIYKKLHQ